MKIFKTKPFAKFAKKEDLSKTTLLNSVVRAERGLIDADLGGGIIKQRIPREGQGRSQGYRIILALRSQKRAIFIHGFAKNEKANISMDELEVMKEIASIWLHADEKKLKLALAEGVLLEIKHEKKD